VTLRHPIRVRYAESDQMGVVHHSAYVIWLEEARTVLLEALGLPYHELEAMGLFFPVVRLELRYRRPMRYGEVAEIEVSLRAVNRRQVTFAYRVLRNGDEIAVGETVHVAQGPSGKAMRMPETVFETLQRALAS